MGDDHLKLTVAAARRLIFGALTGAGTAPRNARYFTEAILDTEMSGLEGHGFYWLQYYCLHVKGGKVKGHVWPQVHRKTAVSFHVDAKFGFAHPAIEAGFAKLIPATKKYGIAAMGVHNSYNTATLGYHTGYVAKRGLVCFGFTNAMPVTAPPGGHTPVIGTNPMSFAVPGGRGKLAFLIDQSSTAVAWTAVKRAAEQGRDIPLGWALDQKGQPTTDPNKGLAGSIASAGGYKGFGIGLMVEVMSAALAGAALGPQQGSFTDNDKKRIDCGQFFIAINPKMFGKDFGKQVRTLMKSVTSQKGARLPNARREANIKRSRREGLQIDDELYAKLKGWQR